MDKSSSREKLFSEVVKKVLLYSSERSTNHSKLAKYLSLIRQQQLNLTGLIEKKLQKCGIVQALILLFNRQLGANNNESSTTISAEGSRKSTTVQVLTTGLSILGNAFAVDSESRRQAEKLAFVSTLKYFLQSTSKFSSNADILSRVLKCLANLAQHDQIRGSILRDGIGITIVIRLEEIYTRLTNTLGAEDKIDEIIIEKDEESIICQAARAIRIFSSNFEFQQHLIRFGAIVALGRFLMFSHNRILFSDILKALAVLTTSLKKIPRDVLEALTDAEPQKSVPQRIITILKSHPSTKCLAEPATICLTQLACNTSLAKSLVSSNVFEVTLQAIKQTEDVDQLEKLLRLLVVLTQESPSSMDCNLSHRLRLSCCSQIGETVKILQMTKLKHYHTWILKLYENLYEDKLKDLVARGIISFLDEYLREKLGDYSFDSLGKKLSAQDDDHCYVHTDSKCPFSPKYRCTSPTYQQMQDIEKRNSKSMEAPKPVQSAFEINNALSSPYSSPPQSPTCDDGDRYAFVGTYSPSESLTTSLTTSPTYSKQFRYSPESSSGSDDEGIGSSSTISPNQSVFSGSPSKDDGNLDSVCTEYSEDECEDNGEVETMDIENIESTKIDDRSDEFEPPKKRAKFDATTITGDDAHGAKRDEILMNIDDDDEMKTNVETLVPQKTDNISLEQIRQRYTKIASILGILNRLSHFTSVPSDLTKFLPFLFEIIWSTRMSVEKAEDNKLLENVEELLPLGSLNLCFQRAFKIVTRICSDINTFPNLVENGVIPLVYRILLYNFREVRESDENEIIIHSRNQYHRSQPCHPRHRTTVKEFINDYSIKLMKTLVGMSGSQNESIGWRHGYFLRTCCIPGQMQSAGTRYVNAILSIPLLYRSTSRPILRNRVHKNLTADILDLFKSLNQSAKRKSRHDSSLLTVKIFSYFEYLQLVFMGKTVKNNKSSWGRVPLGSVANEEVTSQTKSCPTATKMLTRHDFLRGLPSKRFRKIKNLTKGNNTSKNVFRNDVIVGRSVFKTPLHTHRRWHFHRQIFMDRNKKKSQVRITAFGELAHKLFHEVKFHGTYAIRNFTVKKPDRRFHQLKNPLEIHLNNQSEIIPILDDGKYPKDLISSFVPLNKINEIKDSCCIDVRGIVSNKTDCYTKFNYWSRSYWTALDIELVDNTNHSIQLTLPGQHALNFNTPVGGLYEISGVKIHVDIRVPESDDDEQEDDSSSTAEEEEADDENSTNDENEIDDEGNDGTRRKVNRVAKPKYIRSAKVMLCSDHQGDTDGNHDGASSDENSNDGATSSNSSSSDTDYDFDTVDDENEEEISDGSQPPPDELDSQNSISSLSSSHIISSASTYKNSNLLDEEAMELRRWYQETGSKIAHIPVPLCSTSQSPRELRPFEEKTGNWEKIFELLTNVDESVPFTTFQNCILALMCMGQTKGLTWSDAETATKKPLLYPPTTVPVTIPPPVPSSSNTRVDDAMQANKTVVFELDDGSTMTLQKAQLVNASPVFAAMFDGHFREAGQQRVNLRQVSRSALNALAMQIYQQSRAENNSKPNDDSTNKEATSLINEDNNHRSSSVISSDVVNQTFDYELSTIFELLSLCDQFLLDNLYERTLNTLIGFYICPFSAPTIYVESLTFGGLHKSDIQLSSAKNLNLSRLALKYLLVGENISLSMRSGAFWKLFETTLPSVVVQGLREILNVKTPH